MTKSNQKSTNLPSMMAGMEAGASIRLPHMQVSRDASLLDVVTFFERVNNASRLSLIHNTKDVRVRTSASLAISVLDDSSLTLLDNTVASDANKRTVTTRVYEHYVPAKTPDLIVASRNVDPGTAGYTSTDATRILETLLTGSSNAVSQGTLKGGIGKVSSSKLAANIRNLLNERVGDVVLRSHDTVDKDTLDTLSSVLHHYYMIYNVFTHVNAYVYMISRGVSDEEKRAMVARSSQGVGAQSSLLDVMGIMPSTLLSDIFSVIDGITRGTPIQLKHLHEVQRYSSYLAILHTYGDRG